MNTEVSTDLPPRVAETIEKAKTILAQRERERQLAAIEAEDKRRAEIVESWQRPLAAIHHATPTWIHQYIVLPTEPYTVYSREAHETQYTYATIAVQGCNPIAVWVSDTNNVLFEAMQPHLYLEDDDNRWYVQDRTRHGCRASVWAVKQAGDPDIAIALFQAHEAYLKRLKLEEIAAKRNDAEPELYALGEGPDPTDDLPDPIDQAVELLGRFGHDASVSPSALMASATIAVAHHVRRIADSLEAK
jgi:hypothetical protein